LDISNPCIVAWSTDRNNPVGAEYILEKKALGKPLWRLWKGWDQWSMEDRFATIEQVVEIERKLASTKFTKSGCIYLKEDIPYGNALVTGPPLCSSLERFTLGPLVEGGLWRDERATMDLDRGPCESLYNASSMSLSSVFSSPMFFSSMSSSSMSSSSMFSSSMFSSSMFSSSMFSSSMFLSSMFLF
jgi:hypothetical protein